jgi:hypothetical protein
MNGVDNLNVYMNCIYQLQYLKNNDKLKRDYWLELFNNHAGISGLKKDIGIAMALIHPDFPDIQKDSRNHFVKTMSSQCELGKLVKGAICPNRAKEKDHIWPFSLGGISIDVNRADLCEYCNRGKSNTIVGYFPWDSHTYDWVLEKIDFTRRRIGV